MPKSHLRPNSQEEIRQLSENDRAPLASGVQTHLNAGDGVAYDDLIGHCATHNISRGEAEPVLDRLVDDARLYEHTFGRFKHIEAK